jgi:hypothetical protein
MITIYLTPQLADRLRVQCARDRTYLSDAVEMALDEWLE